MTRLTQILMAALIAIPLIAYEQSLPPDSKSGASDRPTPLNLEPAPRQRPTSTETQPKRTYLV